MNIRTFVSGDAEKILDLWNNAHPNTTLTKELMAKKIFLDCNFTAENLLVAEKNGAIIAMAYVPHRIFSIRKDGDKEKERGYITYFAVEKGFSVSEVGQKLLEACEEHHLKGGRKYFSTEYTPLYFSQGFFGKYDDRYIELFENNGYTAGKSYKRCINLESYSLPCDFEERKNKLEKEGVYIGSLPYEYISQFVDSEIEYSNDNWSWEFRTRLSANFDLETARVAIVDGKVIGGCIFGDPNSDEGRFGPLGISPVCRGRGIGSILFADCLNVMKKRGISVAWAQWTPFDGPAHTLYEKAGFGITDCIVSFQKEID